MTNLDIVLNCRDITLPTKIHIVKAIVFPIVMYGCESWTIKKADHWRNEAFELVVLEETLESPLDCKEIKLVNPKGNQPWIFIGRTNAEAEAPILWPRDAKSQLIGKDPDAGKNWRQGEKEATEDEMVGWHHWLNGHEFEQTSGESEGQGRLACCSPRGHKLLKSNSSQTRDQTHALEAWSLNCWTAREIPIYSISNLHLFIFSFIISTFVIVLWNPFYLKYI